MTHVVVFICVSPVLVLFIPVRYIGIYSKLDAVATQALALTKKQCEEEKRKTEKHSTHYFFIVVTDSHEIRHTLRVVFM